MSQIAEPAVEETKPVGTQELPPAGKKKIKHRCCEHCKEDGHAPHTKGCPEPTNGNGEVTEELKAAVAEAIRDQFAVTDSWKPRQVVKFVVDCPSGQKALVRHLDTMDLVRADLVEELDFFTKKLFPSSLDAQGNPQDRDDDKTIWSMLGDPEKRCRFLSMTNKLMATACVKPRIIHDGVAIITNENGEKTDVFGCQVESIDEQIKLFGKPVPVLREGECYAGAIDFADRMAFFSELNKPLAAIEPFRGESDAVLASMEPSKIVGDTSEQPL
jgi:hypothetical protein